MKGKFFAVGVGPGDPSLLTLKAIETIEKSDKIVLPDSGAAENIALKITEKYIGDRDIIYVSMPMTKDRAVLDENHEQAAELIAGFLDEGLRVSFLTLGDPSIYSTVMYVHRKLTKRGYETGIIPGITSFCAAAASLNCSLCEREEMLHIIPATFRPEMIDELEGTKVLMKSGKTILDIKERLSDRKAMMVERASMANERVYKDLNELEEQPAYFSLIVIPSEGRE